jgi:hypothetical protein
MSTVALLNSNRGVRLQIGALTLCLTVAVSGCRSKQAPEDTPAPAPEEGGGSRDAKKNPGAMARIFGSKEAPGYGWDGQSSSTTLDINVNAAYGRCVSTLRAMGFVIKEEQLKKEGGKSHIQGAKPDQTQVSIWLEEPAEKPGSTLVHVKVGGLGDRTGSERVLDEIQVSRKPVSKTAAPAPAKPSTARDPLASSPQP